MHAEGQEAEKRTGNLFDETMAENFQNPRKEKDIHIQESPRVPNKMTSNRSTHILIKMTRRFPLRTEARALGVRTKCYLG